MISVQKFAFPFLSTNNLCVRIVLFLYNSPTDLLSYPLNSFGFSWILGVGFILKFF